MGGLNSPSISNESETQFALTHHCFIIPYNLDCVDPFNTLSQKVVDSTAEWNLFCFSLIRLHDSFTEAVHFSYCVMHRAVNHIQ